MVNAHRHLPSITSITVFEAAARHLSCTGAASELFLTVGAVSKQIRSLEDTVGVPLFARGRHGLLLTEAGRIYLESIRPVLAQLSAATTRALTAHLTKRTLMLRVFPAIAERWLLPRFADFLERYPEIDIQFTTYLSSDRVETSTDAAIRFGEGSWPMQVAQYLVGREVVLAASPSLLVRHGEPETPAKVFSHTLLQHVEIPNAWNDLRKAYRITSAHKDRLVRYDFYSMLVRAAISGMGMALIPRCLITEELSSGVLVNPLDMGYESRSGYYFMCTEDKAKDPALSLFRNWLLKAAAAS